MGKVKGKHRLDKYYHLAKEHGYRSRAAWKLVQMDSKFSFLRSSRGILDLCAAPGGWMQVAVERAPVASLVVGIDLVPIRPVRGAVAIEEDITKTECKSKIKRVMNEHGCRAFDLVLHDGSPNVGGAWAQEATSQNALVIDSVRLATEFLAPKGTFLTKVFRSQDYSAVLYCLKQLFEKVEVEKPAASRSASAEIYIIGLKYKAPAKIDPRLLDIKSLFQSGGIQKQKVVDVLGVSKQKRHRDGYEDGETVLRRVCTAADFIWSATPIDILGSVNSITFEDPASLPIKENALTTAEVNALCEDLRVLGKKDFRDLLRWRTVIRKALSPKIIPSTTDVEPENKETDEEKKLNEMEEMANALDQKNKRAKKLIAKRKAKDKARKAMGTQIDATEDGYTDLELFSLSTMKDKKELVAVDAADSDDEGADVVDSDDEITKDQEEDSSGSDVDSDEERKRYDEKLEDMLDQFYKQYVEKSEGSTRQRKRIKKMADNGELFEDETTTVQSDQDSDNDGGVHEANPLMVELGEEPTKEEITTKWFSQDVFEEEEEPLNTAADKSDTEDEMEVEEEEENHLPLQKKQTKQEEPVSKKTRAQEAKAAAKVEDDFEIVPAPATDSSSDDDSTDDESEDDNVNTKAEILAYAKKMLKKKDREHMLDDAYNKYMFHDDKGLPKWFVEEENKHNVPIKPVTKEEVAAMRAQFKAIDARPAKKVAQAKARKKRVAMRQLEKVRKKANTISDQADISDRSKTKMIDQLYKKATPKRPAKEYVVAKKGVQVKTGKGKVLVDRRMKKDARALKKKGKGGSNKGGKGTKAPKGKGGAGKGGSERSEKI